MKKEKGQEDVSLYEAPLIETVEVIVEKGFQQSPNGEGITPGDDDGGFD